MINLIIYNMKYAYQIAKIIYGCVIAFGALSLLTSPLHAKSLQMNDAVVLEYVMYADESRFLA